MDESELITGKLYWVKDKRYSHVYLVEYDGSWGAGGCFNVFGDDNIYDLKDFEVLGKVELVVPEYAKETGYGD